MPSFIPALNEDCAALILQYLDKLSLAAIACISKTGKAAALPLLIHTIQLDTEIPDKIIRFSHLVLSNQLGNSVRNLEIQHGCGHEDDSDSDFYSAIQPLVDLVIATDNLVSLKVPLFADNLFKWAPGLVDAINAHPPSRTFELRSFSDRVWKLAIKPFRGLRDLSLTFEEPTGELDIFSLTASSTKTLKSLHLCGSIFTEDYLRIISKEGNVPCEAVSMLSFYNTKTTRLDLHKAFPNVQFINSQWSDLLPQPSALFPFSSTEKYSSNTLPNLIGLNGTLGIIVKLAPYHDIRMVRLTQWINLESELDELAQALNTGSVWSLSLLLTFDIMHRYDHLLGDHFFSQLPQFSPQLKFADFYVSLWHYELEIVSPRKTWDNIMAVCRLACKYMAGLQQLKFVVLKFALGKRDMADILAAFRGTATECLRSLPLVDYFALNLNGEVVFVTRRRDLHPGTRKTESSLDPEASAGAENGDGDIFLIDPVDGRRIMEWYRWEGLDARLEGVQRWLESISETL